MSNRKRRVLLTALPFVTLLGCVTVWFQRSGSFPWQDVSEVAQELRKKQPYVSIEHRLAFKTADFRQVGAGLKLALSASAVERLKSLEEAYDSQDAQARRLALQRLHSNQVDWFISRPGNGISRWGRLPTPELLEYPEAPVIAAAKDTERLPESSGISEAQNPESRNQPEPPRVDLDRLHLASQFSFADPWSLGDVANRTQVAGFVAHGMRYLPVLGDPHNQYPRSGNPYETAEPRVSPEWNIARLELVSLLKYSAPTVYVSQNLPQMKELAEVPTRDLNSFETQGLALLESGEDLLISASDSTIEMFGSLRATQQCLNCHVGQRGHLLGAFSYLLSRESPKPHRRKPTS